MLPMNPIPKRLNQTQTSYTFL